MKIFGSVLSGAACIVVLIAPSAQAHTLTAKKAKAALNPVAAELAPKVASKLAETFPAATVSSTDIGFCRISKKGHRADCQITFHIAGGFPDTECLALRRVEFRSKKSKELKVSVRFPAIDCIFGLDLGP